MGPHVASLLPTQGARPGGGPGPRQQGALAGAWRRFVRRQRDRWLTEHWRIGVIDAPIASLLAPGPLPPVRWLTPRDHHGYWADPFGMPGDPSMIFCERFDEAGARGHLERMQLNGDTLRSVERLAVGNGHHASFPNVFELDGEHWGIAETGAARECVLYRVDAEGAWHRHATLLLNIAAADPAIFTWDGRYWLAHADADTGVHDTLYLHHADTLAGPWRAHAANPVKRDAGGARMAGGFFRHDGALYRPGQDCCGGYGRAVVIHRVEVCTPEAYREVAVRTLSPDPHGPLPHGLHTLTAWGDRTLIDGKRLVFNPYAVARKLARRWARSGRPATRQS